MMFTRVAFHSLNGEYSLGKVGEVFWTMSTFERAIARVNVQMLLQFGCAQECLRAHATFVRPNVRVNHQMEFQVAFSLIEFFAYFTLERSNIGVLCTVSQQLRLTNKAETNGDKMLIRFCVFFLN